MKNEKDLKPEWEMQNLACSDIYERLTSQVKAYINVYVNKEDILIVEIHHRMIPNTFMYREGKFVERLSKNTSNRGEIIYNVLKKYSEFINGYFFY